MPQLELDAVGKTYDDGFVAVSDVSLAVAKGEFIVLVGPSGCGKTTTLRMIAGLEDVTKGQLHIGGRKVNDVPARDRDVAMVFQSYALYPHMTVRENLSFGLMLRKLPTAEVVKRVDEVAATLELTTLLDRRPKALSGGQRQRVAMGRAIVKRAGLFLFDEPLSNLDAKLRHQMRVELARLHRTLGATSVYVTHDQVEAMTLADRMVLMNAGRVQQMGAPLDLYERPANLFVATFLGSPSMNLLPADRDGEDFVFEGLRWRLPSQTSAPREVVLGVRPEALRVVGTTPSGREATLQLPALVEVVEPLGHETYVHCRIGARPLVARLTGAVSVMPGESIVLGVEASAVHVFDRQTESRCSP